MYVYAQLRTLTVGAGELGTMGEAYYGHLLQQVRDSAGLVQGYQDWTGAGAHESA